MSFDPYHAWLGIPPEEQPADHYRLLGLRPFESHIEAISNAVDQRMAHLRSMQSGEHADDSQRLLNEVAAAGRCLLNAETRGRYDEKLRESSTAADEVAIPVSVSPASEFSTLPSISLDQPLLSPTKSPAKQKTTAIVWGWVSAGVSVSALVIVALLATIDKSSNHHPTNTTPPVAGSRRTPTPEPVGPRPASSSDNGTNVPAALSRETGTKAALRAPASEPTTTAPTGVALPPRTQQSSLPSQAPFALEFNTGDSVPLPGTSATVDLSKPFTCELWVRPSDLGMEQLLLGNCRSDGANQVKGWQLMLLPGDSPRTARLAIAAHAGFHGEFLVSSGWMHVAVSSDGEDIRLFVNGRVCANKPASMLSQSYVASELDLHLGAHPQLHARQPHGFAGEIRGLRISSVGIYAGNFQAPAKLTRHDAMLLSLDFDTPGDGLIINTDARQGAASLHGPRWITATADVPAAPIDKLAATEVQAVVTPSHPDASTPPTPPAPPPRLAPPSSESSDTPLDPRLAMPPDDLLAVAIASVRRTFAAELHAAANDAATSSDKRLTLARKLQAESQQSAKAAEKLAFLTVAAQLGSEAMGLAGSLPFIDTMEAQFQFDGSQLRVDGLKAAADKARTPSQRAEFVDRALSVARRAADAEQFELALEAARMAQGHASRPRQPELLHRAQEARRAVELARKQREIALAAKRRIDAAAEAGETTLSASLETWGRYLCFVRADWPQGLKALSLSEAPELATLAKQDLTANDAGQHLAVGDQWWTIAEADTAPEQSGKAMKSRAVYHYRAALPELDGIDLLRANKRIRESRPTADLAHLNDAFDRALAEPPPKPPGVPDTLATMLGVVSIDGMPRVFLRYENGFRFTNDSLRNAIRNAKLPLEKVDIQLQGLFAVEEPTTILIRQRGGSEQGRLSILLDGNPLGNIGADVPTQGIYRASVARGAHQISWRISGSDIGNCQLIVMTEKEGVIPLLHTAEMAAAIRKGTRLPTLRMVR